MISDLQFQWIQIHLFFFSLFLSKLGGKCKLPSVPRSGTPYIGHHVGYVIAEIAIVYAVGNQWISMYDGLLCAVHVPTGTCNKKWMGWCRWQISYISDRYFQYGGAYSVWIFKLAGKCRCESAQ